MQKIRFTALQKAAKQKEDEAIRATNAVLGNGVSNQHGIPKQSSAHHKDHDLMMHSKGCLRNDTVIPYDQAGGGRDKSGIPDQPNLRGRYYDEEAPPPPQRQSLPSGQHYGQPPSILPQQPPAFLHHQPLPPLPPNAECSVQDLNKMFGMRGSDIDRYSRIIFPVTFICFQLMYWVAYQHMSYDIVDDLVYLPQE